jgi:tRNA A37 N6-isopentenylltransferase MiaA
VKLYEINSQIETLWQHADEAFDAEASPEHLDKLERLLKQAEVSLAEKAVAIACLIKGIEADIDALAEEELILRNRRKTAERQADWLRAYLAGNLTPGEKIKDARVVISWRKSQSVQLLVDPQHLPQNFRREKLIVEADKVAIKDAFEAGTASTLSGLAEVVTKNTIQIK